MNWLVSPSLQAAAQSIGDKLLTQQSKLTTAESCTGGAIAGAITAIAGSSQWFEGGLVTYSNQLKSQWLNIPLASINRHGVVSEAVVAAMLKGACSTSGAQYGIATSGIAGPDGGTVEQPVGTVCIAWGRPHDVITHTYHFDGSRDAVRYAAVMASLVAFDQYLDTV